MVGGTGFQNKAHQALETKVSDLEASLNQMTLAADQKGDEVARLEKSLATATQDFQQALCEKTKDHSQLAAKVSTSL